MRWLRPRWRRVWRLPWLRRWRVWWLPRLRRRRLPWLRRLRVRWLLVRWLRWLRGLCDWRGLLRLLGGVPLVLRRALQGLRTEPVFVGDQDVGRGAFAAALALDHFLDDERGRTTGNQHR
jgi:hypothetical protein